MRPQKPPRILTVVIHDSGTFTVHEGELVTTRLGWDEFLASIAVITHPQMSKIENRVPAYSRLVPIDTEIDQWIYYRVQAAKTDSADFKEVGQ